MKSLREKFDRKTVLALLAVVVMGIVLAVEWRAMYPSNRDAMRKQMAANGMPMPPDGMPDPAKMQAMMLDNMAKELGLSDTQKTQMKEVQGSMGFPQMRAIFEDSSLSREKKMAKMQSARAEQEMKTRAILTPEQQVKYDKMQAEMQQRMTAMRGRMPGGPNGMGPMGMGGPPPGMGPMMMPPPGGGGMPPMMGVGTPPPANDGNAVSQ